MAIRPSCFLVLLLPGAFGHGFLAPNQNLQVASLRSELRGAISDALGHGHGISADRLAHIRGALTPLFRSLPKSPQGRLSPAVMRYAVQRYFRQQHGWMMKGFEEHALAGNTSDWAEGAQILQSNVPDFMRTALEQKLSHDGFALEDAVVMMATLERLIVDEVIAGVERAYDLSEADPTQPLSPHGFADVLSSYFINEMLQATSDNVTHHKHKKANIHRIYPHWEEAKRFLATLFMNYVYSHQHTLNPFSRGVFHFEDVVHISQTAAEEFGPFSNHECNTMKSVLSSMDPHETGRVKISDFYNEAKGGAWQFEEAFEYLRQSGAVDQSSALLGAQVIIPNYIAGMNNCITSKQYYSICCLNGCDSVYEHLEAAIPVAYASAAEIGEVMEKMVIPAHDGKNLSTTLRTRLEEIGTVHHGKIPMHGRLFAQWLHFVFPRDCPYPHMAGSTNPQSPARFESINGKGTSEFSVEEMAQFLEGESSSIAPSPEAGLLMWNLQEVVLDTTTLSDADDRGDWRTVCRSIALLGMVGGLAIFALKEVSRVLDVVGPEVKLKEYSV